MNNQPVSVQAGPSGDGEDETAPANYTPFASCKIAVIAQSCVERWGVSVDPVSAAAQLFKFIVDAMGRARSRNIGFFDEVIRPAYEKMLVIHCDYIAIFRILDQIRDAESGVGIRVDIRDQFISARQAKEAERDIFRREMSNVILQIQDKDNQIFFATIFLYFIYDEDYEAFLDSHLVEADIKDLRARLLTDSSRSDPERLYASPSARAANEVAKLTDPDRILGLKGKYIDNLNRRMYSISDRFVQIRQRYYPN